MRKDGGQPASPTVAVSAAERRAPDHGAASRESTVRVQRLGPASDPAGAPMGRDPVAARDLLSKLRWPLHSGFRYFPPKVEAQQGGSTHDIGRCSARHRRTG